jgi:hypothetical protein
MWSSHITYICIQILGWLNIIFVFMSESMLINIIALFFFNKEFISLLSNNIYPWRARQFSHFIEGFMQVVIIRIYGLPRFYFIRSEIYFSIILVHAFRVWWRWVRNHEFWFLIPRICHRHSPDSVSAASLLKFWRSTIIAITTLKIDAVNKYTSIFRILKSIRWNRNKSN